MKIKNVLLMPMTIIADIVSLGNMGDRSFTQQLVDSDKQERVEDKLIDYLKRAVEKK